MRRMILPLVSTLAVLLIGCSDKDSGLTKPQVDTMLDIQSSVSRDRSELVRQQDELNERRDVLESDRRDWTQRGYRDPILAKAIGGSMLLLACLLPLVLVALLLWPRTPLPSDEAVCNALIDDLGEDQPRLLPQQQSRRRIE